jgi:hypothetical protein
MGSVLVSFPDARDVFVDNTKCGTTNDPFDVENGTHDFDLGTPHDYVPDSLSAQVADTNPLNPLKLVFVRKPQ